MKYITSYIKFSLNETTSAKAAKSKFIDSNEYDYDKDVFNYILSKVNPKYIYWILKNAYTNNLGYVPNDIERNKKIRKNTIKRDIETYIEYVNWFDKHRKNLDIKYRDIYKLNHIDMFKLIHKSKYELLSKREYRRLYKTESKIIMALTPLSVHYWSNAYLKDDKRKIPQLNLCVSCIPSPSKYKEEIFGYYIVFIFPNEEFWKHKRFLLFLGGDNVGFRIDNDIELNNKTTSIFLKKKNVFKILLNEKTYSHKKKHINIDDYRVWKYSYKDAINDVKLIEKGDFPEPPEPVLIK
jgi:hypothetical protein